MRLFIAVNMPEDAKDAVAGFQDRLKRVPADVRWVEREKFHLTLKFLGEVPEEKIEPVVSALARVAARFHPFVLSLCGLGAFPSLRRPRVLWMGIRAGAEEAKQLAAGIDEELLVLDFPKEKRGFSAHLTLGRVRSPQNIDSLSKKIASLADITVNPFPVRSVELMQSMLHPHGARYQCLTSIAIS